MKSITSPSQKWFKMETKNKIDYIWHYCHYYGDMLFTARRLHEDGESYAALILLFNATELLLKSIRGNFEKNFKEDIIFLVEKQVLTEDEGKYLDGDNGLRKIRNIMTHRDAYEHFLEDEKGVIYSFSDTETWAILFEPYFIRVVEIIFNAVNRANILM